MLQPAAFDGLALARDAAVLAGRLGLESLPRLAQSGCSGSVLDFVLTGEINERGKPGLKLAVDGGVRLQCQRCLGSLDLPVRHSHGGPRHRATPHAVHRQSLRAPAVPGDMPRSRRWRFKSVTLDSA